jgi:hypothetical protein
VRLGDGSFVVAVAADPPGPVLALGALLAGPVDALEGSVGGAPVAPLTQITARLPPEQGGRRPNPAPPVGRSTDGRPLGPRGGMLCWPVIGKAPQPSVAVQGHRRLLPGNPARGMLGRWAKGGLQPARPSRR